MEYIVDPDVMTTYNPHTRIYIEFKCIFLSSIGLQKVKYIAKMSPKLVTLTDDLIATT